jgi:hypothetical protein
VVLIGHRDTDEGRLEFYSDGAISATVGLPDMGKCATLSKSAASDLLLVSSATGVAIYDG